jgi:hypothetical protein
MEQETEENLGRGSTFLVERGVRVAARAIKEQRSVRDERTREEENGGQATARESRERNVEYRHLHDRTSRAGEVSRLTAPSRAAPFLFLAIRGHRAQVRALSQRTLCRGKMWSD